MGGRRLIGPVDTIWLNMDRPENLMVIDSVMWFDEPVDWERLKQVLQHRLVDRYPVFSQRPVDPSLGLGLPHWEDDPDFSLAHHVHHRTLPQPGNELALQRYVEQQMHHTLDRGHPLWEVHLLDGFESGSAVVMRFHHALADGIALAQVMLSLTDDTPTGDLEESERNQEGVADPAESPPRSGAGGLVVGTAATAVSAASAALHLLGGLPHLANPAHAADAFTLMQQTGLVANKLLLGRSRRPR